MIWRKHNPLQILTYFGLKMTVFPLIWSTDVLYLTYNFWKHLPKAGYYINIIANLHLLAGYIVAAFIIVHLCLLTIGSGFWDHVKPMISGYEDITLTPEQETYLDGNEPWHPKSQIGLSGAFHR